MLSSKGREVLVPQRLIGLYKSMGEGLIIMKLTVVLVMVQKLQMINAAIHVKRFVKHTGRKDGL